MRSNRRTAQIRDGVRYKIMRPEVDRPSRLRPIVITATEADAMDPMARSHIDSSVEREPLADYKGNKRVVHQKPTRATTFTDSHFGCGGAYLSSSGGPLTRLPLRWKFTSTWSAILMNGMPFFIP